MPQPRFFFRLSGGGCATLAARLIHVNACLKHRAATGATLAPLSGTTMFRMVSPSMSARIRSAAPGYCRSNSRTMAQRRTPSADTAGRSSRSPDASSNATSAPPVTRGKQNSPGVVRVNSARQYRFRASIHTAFGPPGVCVDANVGCHGSGTKKAVALILDGLDPIRQQSRCNGAVAIGEASKARTGGRLLSRHQSVRRGKARLVNQVSKSLVTRVQSIVARHGSSPFVVSN